MPATLTGPPRLDDLKIHVKLKLAALWTSLMCCYVYGDYFELYQPGKIAGMLQGRMGPLGPVTGGVLLGAAIVMAIPSVMIFGSLVLPPRANRWTNIILGAIYTAIMLLIITRPHVWGFYAFLGALESALSLLIVWHAWTWPHASEHASTFMQE